jgi:proline dehydrogenase
LASFLLRLARQWIAGETPESGIERVKQANSKGLLGLLNLVGERVESKSQVEGTVKEYEKLLDLIQDSKVDSQISVKPTQFGMNIDFDYCVENYLRLSEACKSHADNWLWIDMENSPFTQKTLDLYASMLKAYPNTGVAIQAYMRRSANDLKDLIPLGAKIRLVKGAYNEPADIVYKDKEQIRNNYENLMETLFTESKKDSFVAVATHDSLLIDRAKDIAKENNSVKYEYEMLMGVRDKLKLELVSRKYQVREYVPFGPQWLPYSIRRIREKKSNILLLARSLF